MFKRKYLRSRDPNYRRFRQFYRRRDGRFVRKKEEIRNEFDGLRVMAKSGKLEISNGEIRLPLGTIRRTDKKREGKSIGKILLVIYPRSGEVEMKGGMLAFFRHPTFGCLGNIEEGVSALIRKKEFLLAADLMIRYFETG